MLLLPGLLWAKSLLTIYSRAMRDARSDDPAKVQAAFKTLVDLAEKHPDDNLADDALFQAGEVAERYLSDYDVAEELYRQVIETYPRTKSAMRAKGALRRLGTGRQTGDKAYQLYSQTLRQYSKIGSDEALKRMKRLYEEFPQFNLADRVGYWIAEELARLDNNEAALKYYETVVERWPDTRYGFLAQIGVGNSLIELRKFRRASISFRKLAGMKGFKDAARVSKYYVRITYEFTALWVFFWFTAFVLAWWIVRIAFYTPWYEFQPRHLLQCWPEVLALLVPLGAGSIYVWDRSLIMRWSVFWLMAGGILLLIGNLLHIRLRPGGSIHKVRHALFSGLIGFSLTYFVFYLTDLINILRDSLKMTFNI